MVEDPSVSAQCFYRFKKALRHVSRVMAVVGENKHFASAQIVAAGIGSGARREKLLIVDHGLHVISLTPQHGSSESKVHNLAGVLIDEENASRAGIDP